MPQSRLYNPFVGASGGGGDTGYKGVEAIPSGANTLTVNIGATLPNTDYTLVCEIENEVDSPILYPNVVVTEKTTTTFTVSFNAAMPSANYELNWRILES